MLNANRTRERYYVQRLKESLWSAFGTNRIKPFEDSYNEDQMREWKQRENVKKVHEDLYVPSDPNDPLSDTHIELIIKSVFIELTYINAIWSQSVLEAIFDENLLSPKIDADIIETIKKGIYILS